MATEQKHLILAAPAPRRPIPLLNPRRARQSSSQPSSSSTRSAHPDAPPPPTAADTTLDNEDDKQATPTRKRMAALREGAEAIHLGPPATAANASSLAPPCLRSSPPALGNISNTSSLVDDVDVPRRSASPPIRRGSGTSDASSDLLTAPNSPHLRHPTLPPRTPKPLHTMAGKSVCSPIPRDWTANPLARVRCLNLGMWPGTAEQASPHALQAMEEIVEAAPEESKLAT